MKTFARTLTFAGLFSALAFSDSTFGPAPIQLVQIMSDDFTAVSTAYAGGILFITPNMPPGVTRFLIRAHGFADGDVPIHAESRSGT